MRWAIEPEQKMFVDALSDWLDRDATSEIVRGWLDTADPSPFESRLSADGWVSIAVAEESGGQGAGLLELALVAEQLARRAAPSSAWLASVLALPALDEETTTALIENDSFVALVVPSDSPIGVTSPVTVADGALSGTVAFVLGGDRADLLVVPADGTLYLVETTTPGVTVTPTPLLDRSRTVATITFDGAVATALDVDAAAILSDANLRAAVLIAADALGAASRLLELAVDYSTQRTQFGAPIGSFQAMKHAAATMLVEEEATRSVVYYAAASVDEGLDDSALHAAVAKAQGTASASHSAESALTMHGAIGYTWEHDLQLLYKRCKLDVELFGSPTVWNEAIAGALIGQSFDKVDPITFERSGHGF